MAPHTVKFTVLFLAFQQVKTSLHQIVNVQQLQFRAAVVDGERLVVGNRPAEGGDGTIVLGAAVSHQVHKAVDGNLCAGFPWRSRRTAPHPPLLRPYSLLPKRPARVAWMEGGQHDGGLIVVLFRQFSRSDAKPKLPFMVFRFSGRFTPARLNTKSAFWQYLSNCSAVESRSYP